VAVHQPGPAGRGARAARPRPDGGPPRRRHGAAEREARARVHEAKVALGERGPTWWDGEDYNRMRPENTPYAEWWAQQAR